MRFVDPEEFNGFSVIEIHEDRPPKIKLDGGMRFYTGTKFGDLVKFGRLLIGGMDIREAMDESGIKKHRAFRFARALKAMKPNLKINIDKVRRGTVKYKIVCCQCGITFAAHKRDQNVCSPECQNQRRVEYQKRYNERTRKCRRKQSSLSYSQL